MSQKCFQKHLKPGGKPDEILSTCLNGTHAGGTGMKYIDCLTFAAKPTFPCMPSGIPLLLPPLTFTIPTLLDKFSSQSLSPCHRQNKTWEPGNEASTAQSVHAIVIHSLQRATHVGCYAFLCTGKTVPKMFRVTCMLPRFSQSVGTWYTSCEKGDGYQIHGGHLIHGTWLRRTLLTRRFESLYMHAGTIVRN